MKPSPRFVVVSLFLLTMLVVGWPVARRYHPIAEGLLKFVFIVGGVVLLPIILEWLDRRSNEKSCQRSENKL